MRRSLLFVPGNNQRMIHKALSSQVNADCIILDLEDSVPIGEKVTARARIVEVLKRLSEKASRKKIYVRVNQINSPYFKDDIEIVKRHQIDGIFVPKAEERVSVIYRETGKKIIPIIESASGFLKIEEICRSEGVDGLTLGTADLALSVGGSLEYYDKNSTLRALIVIVARAYGVDPIDKVCFSVSNIDVVEKEAKEARSMGFSGKLAIHPYQVDIINRIFSPKKEEIEWAKKVVDVYERVMHDKKGAAKLNDEMIDLVHYKLAKRILESL